VAVCAYWTVQSWEKKSACRWSLNVARKAMGFLRRDRWNSTCCQYSHSWWRSAASILLHRKEKNLRTFTRLSKIYSVIYYVLTCYQLQYIRNFLRCQILKAASMKYRAFWDVPPCSHVEVDRHFKGAHCLHHQGHDDEDNTNLWNVGQLKRDYKALHPRRL